MSKRQIYILLGFWVIILPFSGIPKGLWQDLLHLFPGLAIIILSYIYNVDKNSIGGPAHPFVDSVRNRNVVSVNNESVKQSEVVTESIESVPQNESNKEENK